MIGYGNSYFVSTILDSGAAPLLPPVNTVAPAITGTAQEGQTVTCSTGTWTGTPVITYQYKWNRNGNFITGATNSTYTLVTADVGQSITCTVTATNGVGSTNADSNTITPIPLLLLDTYTGAAVAYSLRKLRTAYSGSAIRVRRSSDNAEQDINFVGGDLDTASLLTFCGAGNGFVTTWYDQSTNANNATQSTAVNQCQIVSSGAMITDVTTGKITTTWTNDRYTLTSGISTNTQYLSVSMWRIVNSADTMVHLGNTTTSPCSLYLFGTGGFLYTVRSAMSSYFTHSSTDGPGRCIMTSLKNASNLKVAYRNSVAYSFTATEAPSAGTFNQFGNTLNSVFTSGQVQEYIYWNSEQSANRTGIETNINTYWNAY